MPSAQALSRSPLGTHYGRGVWALSPGTVYCERTGGLKEAKLKWAGTTPSRPSPDVATRGVLNSWGHDIVMGTDPEFFLQRDGHIVPAFDFLPDKYNTTDGLFWDGFQAETIVPVEACDCHEKDCLSCAKGRKITCHQLLAQKIGKRLQGLSERGLEIAPQSVWRVPDRMLQLASEAHVALGCDPSQNAYFSEGRVVKEPRRLQYRFAGGHMHFELPSEDRQNRKYIRHLVKTLDALLGVPSVCLAQNHDHFIRRRYYGLAGEYRLPPHGLEYRTLSNFWIPDPRAFMLVFNLGRHALNVGRAHLRNVFVGSERAIVDTINYCDVRSARDFMRLNKEFYSAWATMTYGTDKAFWEGIKGGVDKVIPGWGQDIVAKWKLSPYHTLVPRWSSL